MQMIQMPGIIVPIITPFDEQEEVNEKELSRQIDRQIEAGIHGVFCLGTNGEFYALTQKEKEAIIAASAEAVNRRVPLYAGTGCSSTRETIQLSKRAKALGADALSVICPYFAAASQEDIYRHYASIAEATDLPLLLYNIPARTGNSINPATAERLSKIASIVAIKDSSGNFDNMLQYIELTRGTQMKVISGNDSLILWNLLAGGIGGIAGCANIFPRTLVSIYDSFIKGDLENARNAQDSLRPLRNVFRFGNPNTIVKVAVAMLGYPIGNCRAPFQSLCIEGRAELCRVLENCAAAGMR